MGKAYIGTSGWQYSHWHGNFYPQNLPQKDWLGYYKQYFDTVEVNATFYHQMKAKTFENWRKTVGSNFVFSIKGSRFITHIKRLKDCQEPVKRFFETADGLMDRHAEVARQQFSRNQTARLRNDAIVSNSLKVPGKIGRSPRASLITKNLNSNYQLPITNYNVILWQLPPRFRADPQRLENFLKLIHSRNRVAPAADSGNVSWRHAFEFRDKSWLDPKIYSLLKDYNSALVIQDSPYWPTTEILTADFVYLRFHGHETLYASCYSSGELDLWSKKVKQWLKKGRDVYGYFNNDAEGYAVKNASDFKRLLADK